jgi:hypothetical protein
MEVLCSDLKNLQINHVQNPLQIPSPQSYNFQFPVSNALQNQIHQQVAPNQRPLNGQFAPNQQRNQQFNNQQSNFQSGRAPNQQNFNRFNNNMNKPYNYNNPNSSNQMTTTNNNQNYNVQQPVISFCAYCNTEGHTVGRCRWVIQDKQAGLLQDRMDGFFLPRSDVRMTRRGNDGIRQQVIKYSEDQANAVVRGNLQQQNTSAPPATNTVVVPPPVTPTSILTKENGKDKVQELKARCGVLEEWNVPGIVKRQTEVKAGAGTKLYGVEMRTRSGKEAEPEASTSKSKKKKHVSINEIVEEIDAMDVDDHVLGEKERGILEDSLKRIDRDYDSDKSDEGSNHTRKPSYIIPNDGDFVKDRTEKGLRAFADKTQVVSEVVEKIMKGAIELQIKELCAIFNIFTTRLAV